MDNTLKNNSLLSQVAAPDKSSVKTKGYTESNHSATDNKQESYESVAKNIEKTEGKEKDATGNNLPNKASGSRDDMQSKKIDNESSESNDLGTEQEPEINSGLSEEQALTILGQSTDDVDGNKEPANQFLLNKSTMISEINTDEEAAQNMQALAKVQSYMPLSRVQLEATDNHMSLSQYVYNQYNKGVSGFDASTQNNVALDNVVLENDLANTIPKENIEEQLKVDKNTVLQDLKSGKTAIEGDLDLSDLKSGLMNSAAQELTQDPEQVSNQMKNALEIFNQNLKSTQSGQVQSQHAIATGQTLTSTATNAGKLDAFIQTDGQVQDNSQKSTVNGIPDKIQMMLSKQDQSMRIMLEPPELGAMEIKIHSNSGSTHISFHTQVASTKDVIESQMQDLRDMLGQQGVDLGDVNVFHQDSSQQDSENPEMKYTARFEDAEKEDIEVHQLQYRTNSRLDLFA